MIETNNPKCLRCKTELTDEEVAIKSATCWLCLAAELKKVGESDSIPDPAKFGRPDGYNDLTKKENLKAMQAIVKAGQAAPDDLEVEDTVSDNEKQSFKSEYGVDFVKIPTTVITVKGKNDETYMQFSVRGQVPPKLKKEFERIMANMLELFGTLLSFGSNFGGTVAGLRLMTMDQFFKQ